MPTSAMTHIAIQEALDGEVVDWMEQVSEHNTAAKDRNSKVDSALSGAHRSDAPYLKNLCKSNMHGTSACFW